ncbi:MAG: hypothetical protein ACLSA2_06990 [Candidatus Gastranaerophilaceae bacterium]
MILQIKYCDERVETHGDEIHLKAMSELFSGKFDTLDVIKLRDMYKEIENALDACFNVSDTILSVVLKERSRSTRHRWFNKY